MTNRSPILPRTISPALNRGNPELISAVELNQWADRVDAKQAFPELMRRLLAQTPGITNIDVRAHEGTSAPGWDGTADSAGSSFLPAGKLRFEFGTNKNPKAKAESDYNKRATSNAAKSDQTFIFVTPRNWPGAQGWATEHTKGAIFAEVKAIDAHGLEGWLQATPPVHYWISERLGRHPRAVSTLQNWWESFQRRSKISIPPEFYMAGRKTQSDKLVSLLLSPRFADTIPIVKSSCSDESLAFIYAALVDAPDLLERAMVVATPDAWHQLAMSHTREILIPTFNHPDLHAVTHGHRVVLVTGSESCVRRDEDAIELPKIGRAAAVEALEKQGTDLGRAGHMVALARRSLPAFLRSVSRNPSFEKPEWVQDAKKAAMLVPLVLVGSWDNNKDDDQRRLEEFVGLPFKEIIYLLKDLCNYPDAPFVQSGGYWRLANPTEAAELLLPSLESDVLERWKSLVIDVLLVTDSFADMTTNERLAAQFEGMNPGYSDTLQKHVAEGLALAATTALTTPGMLHLQSYVDHIVNHLFQQAYQDASGAKLAGLSKSFSFLAEASPDIFLESLEKDLTTKEPLVRTLFWNSSDSSWLFESSSSHPNLLWALERLCWSVDHYGRATSILARLMAIDPGGKMANRPLDSLYTFTVGCAPYGAASAEDKIIAIGRAVKFSPDTGWKLMIKLWPSRGTVTMIAPSKPQYRDWEPPQDGVTRDELYRYVKDLVDLALDVAGDSADRWVEIIEKIGNTLSAERPKIIDALRNTLCRSSWSPDEVYRVWDALTNLIERHTRLSDADSAMPDTMLAELREIAAKLESSTDPRHNSRLFNWDGFMTLDGLKYGDNGFEELLEEKRRQAVKCTVDQGAEATQVLIENAERPEVVGDHLAQIDGVCQSSLLVWLDAESSQLQHAVRAYARRKVLNHGVGWLKAALEETSLSDNAQELLMSSVPISKTYWTEIDTLDSSLVAAYWRQGSVYQIDDADRVEAGRLFLEHDCPWQAVDIAGIILHDRQELDVDFVKSALDAACRSVNTYNSVHHTEYAVSELLKWLEHEAPDDPVLPGLEFQFFDFLHEHDPSNALYRALGSSPADFVQLVRSVYDRDSDEAEGSDISRKQKEAHFWRSLNVLNEWSVLPGSREDGMVDGDHLLDWIKQVRDLLAQCGCLDVGDSQIGHVLSCSPDDTDGIWPAMIVRDAVEEVASKKMDSGIATGKLNRRGVSSREEFGGGGQERDLSNQYSEMARQVASRWPRTAAILRNIAVEYEGEAQYFDTRAERLADDG